MPLWHAMKCKAADLHTCLGASTLLVPCSSRAGRVLAGLISLIWKLSWHTLDKQMPATVQMPVIGHLQAGYVIC